MRQFHHRLNSLSDLKSDRIIHLHFDEYIKNLPLLVETLAKVGLNLDIGKITEVAKVQHSTGGLKPDQRIPYKKKKRLHRIVRTLRDRFSI